MTSYALRRILLAILVALAVSIISFLLLRLTGDVAVALAGSSASAADIEAVRKTHGLDRPLVLQYLDWLGRVLQGDLGTSFFFQTPVVDILAERLPVTLRIGLASIVLAIAVGVPLGVAAGLRPNSWLDRFALVFAVAGQAVPSFWLALMLIILFGVKLHWLPISGSGTWRHYILPSIILGYYAMPSLMRLTRASMIEVMAADYVRTARAKGLNSAVIVIKHAMRNAIMPVVALAAVQFGFMLGGSVVIENVFALHGVGYLAWESVQRADIPVVQSTVLVLASIFVVLNLGADLLNALLNPRMRAS